MPTCKLAGRHFITSFFIFEPLIIRAFQNSLNCQHLYRQPQIGNLPHNFQMQVITLD